MNTRFDAVVVGAGMAGAALALRLARNKWRVALISREASELPQADGASHYLTEAAPSEFPIQLARLGITGTQLSAALSPCSGLLTSWGDSGSGTPLAHHASDSGWRVDRAVLQPLLVARARRAGALLLRGYPLTGLRRSESSPGWDITLGTGERRAVLNTRYVVDASGRGAAVAALLHMPRRWIDRMVALNIHCPDPRGGRLDPLLDVIEAVPDGWWWSMEQVGGGRRISLMTDADLCAVHGLCDPGVLQNRIAAAPAAEQHLLISGQPARLRVSAAATGVLAQVSGADWLAVGEAAVATDPLVASGLEFALASAELAHMSLLSASQGNAEALTMYNLEVQKLFDTTCELRRLLYMREGRYPKSPFWQRRIHGEPGSPDSAEPLLMPSDGKAGQAADGGAKVWRSRRKGHLELVVMAA
jgi:flavin-dependent dehydrogenase